MKLFKILNNNLEDNSKLDNKLFNNINGYSLDCNQRKAIVSNYQNTLVVAGAGSGKTLTIVGKIKYLIEELHVKKEDILCISFTNESVNSLKKKCLYDVLVLTFHKLGLMILKDSKVNYKIASSDTLEYIVNEYFESFIYSNLKVNYFLDYFKMYIKNQDLSIEKIKTKYFKYFLSYKRLIIKFINILKSNDYVVREFRKVYLSYTDKCFLIIALDIYRLYIEELNSKLELDFDMMITKASQVLDRYPLKYNFQYIIIDEFQDTSWVRYKMIKKLQEKLNSKLFLVGDDFQSIYRFSGCTLDLFVNFKDYFKDSHIFYLDRVYRNSQELINISYNFIKKNPYQLRKVLVANKYLKNPVKLIYYKDSDYKEKFYKLLDMIRAKGIKEVLVLGRCNQDINLVYKEKLIDNHIIYKDMALKFLTVHTAKGLESEEVILLNVVDDVLGFPNKIEDNKILNIIFKNKEKYEYAEERRLFYVALTRTKNNIYLFSKRNNESIFLKEIKKSVKVMDIKC